MTCAGDKKNWIRLETTNTKSTKSIAYSLTFCLAAGDLRICHFIALLFKWDEKSIRRRSLFLGMRFHFAYLIPLKFILYFVFKLKKRSGCVCSFYKVYFFILEGIESLHLFKNIWWVPLNLCMYVYRSFQSAKQLQIGRRKMRENEI